MLKAFTSRVGLSLKQKTASAELEISLSQLEISGMDMTFKVFPLHPVTRQLREVTALSPYTPSQEEVLGSNEVSSKLNKPNIVSHTLSLMPCNLFVIFVCWNFDTFQYFYIVGPFFY